MSKLKSLLLAGAMIPALALVPMQAGFAQAPDQGPGGPGMRGPGARGEGGGGQGPRGGMRREGAEQHGQKAEGPGAAGEAGGAERRGRRNAEQRAAPGGDAGPGAGADDKRQQREMRRQERPDKAGREAPGADSAPSAGADDKRQQREMRRQERPDKAGRRDEDTGGPRNGRRDDAGPAGGPGAGRMGNNPGLERGPGPERSPGPGERGPGERRMGTGPGPGPERGPGPDHGPGIGERGPGGPGERGPDRRLGNGQDRGPDDRRRGGLSPAGAAVGVAAGFAGGFMAGTAARSIGEIRRDRRETVEDGRTFIREPGRTIVEDGDRRFLVHDPNDRFRELGYRSNRERRGTDFVDTVVLAGGVTVLTFTTPDGRLLRRVRRGPDGREVILFENVVRPVQDDVVLLPPPPLRIPRDRYVIDYANADEGTIYDTLIAPPVAPPPRRYSLDQVLYSPDVRSYVRSVDIDTINFDTGAWVVPGDQTRKLVALAQAINKAVDRDPNSVFLIEGYTDATGNPTDNLSLSDRRAQSVAAILSKDFQVPPENLTTQGYGDQNPKERTSGPSAVNRRVVVRNITQLLAAGGAPPQ